MFLRFAILILAANILAADVLDIRILRVEFKYEDPDNSLTTGRGIFNTDDKNCSLYKLDPCGERHSEEYWQSHIEFARNYFEKASGSKVSINATVYPKEQKAYQLNNQIIDYNRTSRRKGEKLAEFDSARTADYARFVNDVLTLAKQDTSQPLAFSNSKRVILIAHAGSSRLVDGGTMGTRGADTPGDFIDAHIDTSWGDYWHGFEASEGDTITSVIVVSETASQDGLNWGINGTITSLIGRELSLPYSYDVVKGFSRLGYFDGMDFAGANAGNGFFPSLPSAWMRAYKGWDRVVEISPPINGKVEIEICAAGHANCDSPQIVKIPINNNEYILLENRQRTYSADGTVSVGMLDKGIRKTEKISVDSLQRWFLDSATQKYNGVIESIDAIDAAIPASGIAAWRVNEWYIKEVLPYGAVNAWNGDTFRDHQFGIALIEADGILGLGKEFSSASGESAYYFGSGSDLIPHKRFNAQKQFDTLSSINPIGYANTASTFGGYSGIKITAKAPQNAQIEKTLNMLTGDSVINWRALKIPIEIERIGELVRPIAKEDWPEQMPTDADFDTSKTSDSTRISIGSDSIYLANNRLYAVDSNSVSLPNFPVVLSNGEPFTNFNSKPFPIDLTGNDSLFVLVPVNNGLILAVNSNGKLLSSEFPLAAGTFEYESDSAGVFPLLLHVSSDYKYLFAKHRDSISVFHLPKAKEYVPKSADSERKDEIAEFFIFPNPIRAGKASARFRILNDANSATLDIFDITARKVFSKTMSSVNFTNEEPIDISKLGSDIYSARLTVKFASGTQKQKWVRIGVIR